MVMLPADDSLRDAESALKSGKLAEAEQHARRVLRERPHTARAAHILALTASDIGDDGEALRMFRESLVMDPRYIPSYRVLTRTYYAHGKFDDAAALYRGWAAVEPTNPEVLHMLAATTGEAAPSKCSGDYVTTHFNHFASDFDRVLVEKLSYRGPEVIASALARHRNGSGATLEVLDAGCGTGLCGPVLRDHCRTLSGVDLSDAMIEQARKRACYDKLVAAELCEFMAGAAESFDAIVSADVLIYFGALEQLMAAVHTSLRSEGLFVFALEALLDEGSEPYKLTASGRYAHRDSYLRQVTDEANLQLISLELDWLRWERGQKAQFYVGVARKAPSL
jgi:predicted TPR repeat methyltransferase